MLYRLNKHLNNSTVKCVPTGTVCVCVCVVATSKRINLRDIFGIWPAAKYDDDDDDNAARR